MVRTRRYFIALTLASLSLTANSAEPANNQISLKSATPGWHDREEETTRIRTHHLRRLAERLTAEPGALRETCRYESEISTPPPRKQVVLSFDDGPEPIHTEYILETLKRHDIPGTFFVIGHKAKGHPELVAQIKADGRHIVANHSWDHPNFHDISPAEQAGEVLQGEEPLGKQDVLKLFRYPYGNSSCETNALLRTRGYRIVGWHVDSCDWAFDRTGGVDDKEALSCGVLAQNRKDFVEHVISAVRAHNGGIILFHEIHPNTLRQLDEIILRLQQDGFTFASPHDEAFQSSLR